MFGKNKYIFFILVSILASFLMLSNLKVVAQSLKDSDLDGISDQAEINTYHTNPNSADTDTDGIMDYKEIIDKTNPNDPKSNILKLQEYEQENIVATSKTLAWFIGRATGIASFVLFTIVVWFGLIMSSRSLVKFRFLTTPTALETHKSISLIALLMVIVHFSSFFYDTYLKLKLAEALVPFLSKSQIKSAYDYPLATTIPIGIFAFYFGILLVFTSYFRAKIVSMKAWRIIHYSTFVFYILFMIHGIIGGTDTKEWWMTTMYIVSFVVFMILLLMRIFSKKLFYAKPKPKVLPTQQVPSLTTNTTEQTPTITAN